MPCSDPVPGEQFASASPPPTFDEAVQGRPFFDQPIVGQQRLPTDAGSMYNRDSMFI